jgi:predicted ArsR family transcriptional regulator
MHRVEGWTFITNHARVLLCIARNPKTRLRDIADEIGITERAAQRIVSELVDAGYVSRRRVGRRNRYRVNRGRPMRAPEVKRIKVGEVLSLLLSDPSAKS